MVPRSLKTKFVIITCFACLISLIMVSAVSFYISLNTIKNQINQKESETVLKNASIIDNWFACQQQLLNNIANNIEHNQNFDEQYLGEYLSYELSYQKEQTVDYYIGLSNGKLVSGAHWDPPSNYNPANREWYQAALKQNDLIYTTPYKDAMTGKMVITLAKPLYKEKKVVGVIAADIMVDELIKISQKAGVSKSGYSFLLDQNGNFLVHPLPAWQPRPKHLQSAYQVLQGRFAVLAQPKLGQEISTIKIEDYDGTEKYFITTRVNTCNWIFGEAIPQTEYLQPLKQMIIGFVITLVLSLLFGIIFTLLIVKRLIKPIKELRSAVKGFSPKDLATRSTVQSNDEIGELSESFNEMAAAIESYNRDLEEVVQARTSELQEKSQSVMEGIIYAKRIQESILPNLEQYQGIAYDEHFIIWKPRDMVGGDLYWSKQQEEGLYIALIDCTGHGVPGALMTMMVSAVLDRIVAEGEKSPASIISELNRIMQVSLGQDSPDAMTNDGLDIGLCLIKPDKQKLIFAASKISLFVCRGDEIIQVKGEQQSIGYKKSLLDYEYIDHHFSLNGQEIFYLTSDGFVDQNGSVHKKSFGLKLFKETILALKDLPMVQQKEAFLNALSEYMGEEKQRDDITLIAFKI